ncbi:MAG: hypothetical protein DMG33_17995, partial [Acidobacteria bacterium]
MERRFYTLDVFTTTRFEGNPLAVVTDGDGLSERKMLAIAREMNLSETVFVQKPTEDRALARLRIFTTQEELKLAGHPVVGTWFLLAELGVVPAQEGHVRILQQTGAGILPVEIRFHDGRPEQVTMTQKDAAFRPARVKKRALAAALGISLKDFDPKLELEFVSTGIFNLMVPLRNRATLGKIEMNMIELRRVLGNHGTMAYCFALGPNDKAFARGMLPWELYEDAATGSAAGSCGAYLMRHGRLAAGRTLRILQGVEMGRPS